jgi:hypothetical protein
MASGLLRGLFAGIGRLPEERRFVLPKGLDRRAGFYGDPVVWLSDGTIVAMSASIRADAQHVRMVTYILQVPQGVRVLRVVYTGGVLKDKERVVVVPDGSRGYKVEAFADLGTRVAPVTINVAVKGDRRSQSASSTTTFVFLFR